MGIPGLTKYINENSDVFLREYSLHNTHVVIDANNMISYIYRSYDTGNAWFGGDYDIYTYYINNFFDDLLKCNVTPLIIFDGGLEDKKLDTIEKRTRAKIQTAKNLQPTSNKNQQLFPFLRKEIFKSIVHYRRIKCTQSLFEADGEIASVARILNCPVLSYDSDYYIFDVDYIPLDTLDDGITRIPNGNGYVKNCKIYKIDHLMQCFPGIDKKIMPLAAILLGNDYISQSCFDDFFSDLRLFQISKNKYNDQQSIEAIFNWLQNQTLDSSIATILSKLNPNEKEKILEIMEMIINGYLQVSSMMLGPLGYSNSFIDIVKKGISTKLYKFQQGTNNLKVENVNIVKLESETKLLQLVPQWFIEKFYAANFPSYFIDMLLKQVYMVSPQIEVYSQPTCITISSKIIYVIFKILTSGIEKSNTLEYIARHFTNTFKYKLQNHNNIECPSLSDLCNMSFLKKKEIFNETLGVTEQLLNQFPKEWRLYVATIKYWMDEAKEQFTTECHVYSLLFAMLFHVVDEKIGFYRSKSDFQKKYEHHINILQQNQNSTSTVPNMSIYAALKEVNHDDCLLAMPFFLSNFNINQKELKNSKISIVHAFSLFQNALSHSMHLNALLGYPYSQSNIGKFINCTLFYNLYDNFKNQDNIKNYVKGVLQNSPSLLQLFISISTTIESMFIKDVNKKMSNINKRKNFYRNNKMNCKRYKKY